MNTVPLDGRPIRILLAEDNLANQMIANRILDRRGYCVDTVENGVEALRALEEAPYDVVLMDIRMPKMDGLEATRRIRDRTSCVRNHDIPIIALTAYAVEGEQEHCLESGVNDYVARPLSSADLLNAVEKWVKRAVIDTAHPTGEPLAVPPEGFDRAGLLDRTGGDVEFAAHVLDVFLADASQRLESIKDGCAQRDAVAVRHQAHTLKGAAGNVGAIVLHDLSRQIETAAAANDLEPAGALLGHLEEALEQFRGLVGASPDLAPDTGRNPYENVTC